MVSTKTHRKRLSCRAKIRSKADLDESLHSWWGYPLACPPDSRIRRAYNGLEINSLPRGPAFVHDHTKTMDLCANPEWQYLHGA